MKYFILTLCLFECLGLDAQQWIDTSYNIQSFLNVEYGIATDFAGNERRLTMDISVPSEDEIPTCGRPLLVAIHGGAFLGGTKEDGVLQSVRNDFAQRGYVTASINYRLGMFQTSSNIHCNLPVWDCYNMADTSEWFRGLYRGVQDAKGAIRYLINRAEEYQIDPENVFLVGESAGGFIALATAFWDQAEVPGDVLELAAVSPPHAVYENQCIQGLQLDTSISSMQLSRPDLGPLVGTLNPTDTNFRIRGVASFYGGMISNLFQINADTALPAVYLFHQPNDLIVPFNYQRVLSGYTNCSANLAGCGTIVNRPFVYGGKGIANLLDTLVAQGQAAPEYLFEATNNNADCLLQVINPSLVGHALDNYWLRSSHVAAFFADKIDTTTCGTINHQEDLKKDLRPKVYPNPTSEVVNIELPASEYLESIELVDLMGSVVYAVSLNKSQSTHSFPLPEQLTPGMYLLVIKMEGYRYVEKLLIKA